MNELIDTLLTTLPISDEDFSKLFAEAYNALNMSDADLAKYLSTSRPCNPALARRQFSATLYSQEGDFLSFS